MSNNMHVSVNDRQTSTFLGMDNHILLEQNTPTASSGLWMSRFSQARVLRSTPIPVRH